MAVEADKARGGEGLGHQNGRVAVAAPDVGHRDAGLQSIDHAVDVQRAIDTVDVSDIVIVPSVVLGAAGWGGSLPARGGMAAPDARAGRDALLGVFGHLPAGRDRPLRRPGRDRALRIRPHVHRGLPRGAHSSGTSPADLGRARRAGEFRRLVELARRGSVPDREVRGLDRRAGGGEAVRPAMASRRTGVLHRGSTRSAGGSATRMRRSSGGCSSERRAWRLAPIASASAFPRLQDLTETWTRAQVCAVPVRCCSTRAPKGESR